MKSRSSHWVHQTLPKLAAFAWREGYGAVSVSKSQEATLMKHIAGQHEQPKHEDLKTQFLQRLRSHEIEFDERCVLDQRRSRSSPRLSERVIAPIGHRDVATGGVKRSIAQPLE